MRTFRSNLTRLKNKIQNELPEVDNIYGYEGFSKKLIIDEIENIYNLSRKIEEDDSISFEKIYLERLLGIVNEELKKVLDFDNPEVPFRLFLDYFSDLVNKTKQSYFLVEKKWLIQEIELSGLEDRIDKIKKLHSVYLDEYTQIHEIDEKLKKDIADINNISESIEKSQDNINDFEENIITKKEKYESIYDNVEDWDKEINESRTEINLLKKDVNNLNTTSNQIFDNLKNNEQNCSDLYSKLKNQEKRHEKFLETISKTLDNANRVGMAGSFKERKDEIGSTQNLWIIVFIGSLIVISILSFLLFIIFPVNDNLSISIESLGKIIIRLGIISPILWLAWFSSKQYSLTNKIREDYSYKYASSMAYEGYKKAADDCDENLAIKLLESSMNNISQHPVRLFSKSNEYTTPFSESFDSIVSTIAKFNKISVKIPGIKGFVDIIVNDKNSEDDN